MDMKPALFSFVDRVKRLQHTWKEPKGRKIPVGRDVLEVAHATGVQTCVAPHLSKFDIA